MFWIEESEDAEQHVLAGEGAVGVPVGDEDEDAFARFALEEAEKGAEVVGVEHDAGQLLFVHVLGELFGLDPGGADEFKGKRGADADGDDAELADDAGRGAEEGRLRFGNVGAGRNPGESCVCKLHGTLPTFHRDDV